VTFILKFGGDLQLKGLDLTWSGQVDIGLTAATLWSNAIQDLLQNWNKQNAIEITVSLRHILWQQN